MRKSIRLASRRDSEVNLDNGRERCRERAVVDASRYPFHLAGGILD